MLAEQAHVDVQIGHEELVRAPRNRQAGNERAPVQRVVPAPHAGWVQSMAVRELGVLVVTLGGGRRTAGDTIDPRVGLSEVCQIGDRREAGEPLAVVHAATEAAAEDAVAHVQRLVSLGEAPPVLRSVILAAAHTDPTPPT